MKLLRYLNNKAVRKGRPQGAFTLVELMVSMAVLLILLVVTFQIFSLTSKVSVTGNKRMDTDTQARTVFDRMALDFGRMVIRKDVDYYYKQFTDSNASRPSTVTANADNSKPSNPETGNDQIAFYSQVEGYYSSSGATSDQGPLSLVAYRINANSTSANYNAMERLGKGLVWTATGTTDFSNSKQLDIPMVFYPNPIAVSWKLNSSVTYSPPWPQAASSTATDPNNDYELIGPGVIRFEYFYTLKQSTNSKLVPVNSTVTGSTPTTFLSNTPWDPTITNHISLNGWQDVAAITVVIAVVDSKTLPLISQTQMAKLTGTNGNSILTDFDPQNTGKWTQGQLESQWRTAITQNITPPAVAAAIRVYSRTFYLTTPSP